MTYESIFKPELFSDQVIIVTGGGSGIGRCTAHELAAIGATVVLTGRRIEKLETVAAEIREDGGKADVIAFDIRDEDAVIASVSDILARHGKIDGLVNNAGGQFPARLEDISNNGWNAVVATNLTGGFLVSREVYRQWMKANGGAIVNIIADMWRSMVEMGHSGAARAGMMSFTETAAVEWGPDGVRVNAVAPGTVATELTINSMGWDVIKDFEKTVPMGRLADKKEIAYAVAWLASPETDFLTGQLISPNGGQTIVGI